MMNNREPFNKMETLHGEFYENALKYPERIALIYENEKVSYKMLRLYALRAANYMWQRGVNITYLEYRRGRFCIKYIGI